MANRVFQGLVHQMEGVIDRVVGVMDAEFNIIASSNLNMIGGKEDSLDPSVLMKKEEFTSHGYTYKSFGENGASYLVFVEGEDQEAKKFVGLLSISFQSLEQYNEDKNDCVAFIKNVLLDNILPGDIYQKSRELNFEKEASRVVLLVHAVKQGEGSILDNLQGMFPEKEKDFVIGINETDFAVVKQVNEDVDIKDLEQLGRSISDTLSSELLAKVSVGIGNVVLGIRSLANSFKEAQTALKVGKIFDVEKNVISYNRLGIARLIYQIPDTVCDMFMGEIFKMDTIDSLDSETLFTIHEFFDNNLNVSETSRKLFIHRNTLVYRLEKIKRLTGLDLREFDDAIVFKVALMVDKYLSSMEEEN